MLYLNCIEILISFIIARFSLYLHVQFDILYGEFIIMTLTTPNIKPFQLTIVRCGDVSLNPSWSKNKAYSPSSRLYYVLEGGGYVKTDKQDIILEPGNMYLIPSHFHHNFGCVKMRKLYFMFSLTSSSNTDILSSLKEVYQMPADPAEVQVLLNNYQGTDCLSIMKVHGLLIKHICQMLKANNIPPISMDIHSPMVERAKKYIQQNAKASTTIKSISQHLFVSESTLRTSFLRETGITMGQYIGTQIVNQAKKLLEQTSRSIGEISATLGYCDQFYFSRQFKKETGMTPSAYRRKKAAKEE